MWEENLEVVSRAWEAWLRRDFDAMATEWDPDVIWSTEHFHDWPESSYRGPEGVRQFLSEWLDVWGDYEVTIDEVLAAPDGRVVSLFRHRGKGQSSGAPMDLEMANIVTIRNGRIVRFDNYDSQAEALDAAGVGNPGN
jgi:ketosteroid isomerase-like protein